MAISLIPMRIGEFVRPYLVSTRSKIPLSSGLATIFVERILDSLTLLFMLIIVILHSNVPGWLIKTGQSLLAALVIIVCFMLLLYYKTESTLKLISPLLNKLPEKINIKIKELIRNFVDGFNVIASPKKLIYSVFLSVFIWVFSALAIYSLYYFQNLPLPLFSSFVVLVITIIGISLPAAPGFLGNFQFACIMALSIFDVPKSDALAFSMIYYFLGIGINIALGLAFLPLVKISFKEIKNKLNIHRGSFESFKRLVR